jgi:CysZ protein
MLKEIIISIQSYFEAHRFIIKHRLWKWIFIPGVFYSILFLIGLYFFWTSYNAATAWIFSKLGVKVWLDQMKESWLSFFFIIGQIFFHFLILLFYISIFKFVFLIIGSPIFAYLSEKTESILTGKEFPFSFSQLYVDFLRGIKIALRNMKWQTLYMIAFLFISLIPVAGWITPLIVFFIDCFYMGFSMLDYSSERNNLSASASIDLINHHKGLAIGNGMVFYSLHIIPVFGWIFAPSYAVIAATLSLHKARASNVIIE